MGDEQLRLGEHQKLRIVSSTPDVLKLESSWQPSDQKPPSHYHPNQDEHFEILEGEVTVELGRDPARTLVAGDTLDVPRGTPHRMWNAGPGTARALWHVTPAMRTKEMFEYMGQGMSPARAVGMLWRFRNEYRLRVI
jgi:mannose-6-phosphate isomerase-like protein (cupin superfamily)